MKNLSVHVSALVSAAGSALAIVHPGFTIPPFVQGVSVLAAGGFAFILEFVHFSRTHTLAANLALAEKMAEAGLTASQAPVSGTSPASVSQA